MKISPLMTGCRNNINFKNSAGGTINPQYRPNYDNNEQDPHPSHGCLRSLGNGIYWGLVLNAIVITPIVKHNLDKTWQQKMEYEHSINQDFYNLSDRLYKKDGKATAYFHLNKLHDVDGAMITKASQDDYFATFELDEKAITMHMNISDRNKDSISGVMTIKDPLDNDSLMWINDYSIKFSDKNINDFTLKLKSREDNSKEKTLTLSRQGNTLYLVENGKKTLLNSKNITAYEENQKLQEESNEMYRQSTERNRVTLLFLALLTLIKLRAAQIRQAKENNSQNQ